MAANGLLMISLFGVFRPEGMSSKANLSMAIECSEVAWSFLKNCFREVVQYVNGLMGGVMGKWRNIVFFFLTW